MISGRGLGHTGGTLDKLESIPGFQVGLSLEAYAAQIRRIGVSMIGQTAEIAPADRKLYALRDVTATVESIPLICASIMSKKLAEGINALVLNVTFGRGAFMKEKARARELATAMVAIGHAMGKPTRALLTAMDQPLGRAVGNAVEVIESIEALKGRPISWGLPLRSAGKCSCSARPRAVSPRPARDLRTPSPTAPRWRSSATS
jgi:pyrimidine-nucleoside phosphorylase